MRTVTMEEAPRLLASVQPRLTGFGHATAGLFGRDAPAVILRAACPAPMKHAELAELDELFRFKDTHSLVYRDARRGISKRVMVEAGRVTAVRLTGETAARDWLKEVVAERTSADAVRRWVLAPVSALPTAVAASRGRIVCNCLNVAESEIMAEVTLGADLPALQAKLKCGTSCGSCVPELKRLVAMRKAA